ncbi:GNAT family N-acetyltransferase [Polluticaenibacter yanchengensis]|uniref:N-acetyltransferase domain-containing protein n=1 Tax=Polluticaenibacter yanchengensis TaxID=3014562 RepID=A0ABT4UI17_9BACT|nr:hypothetical protein [Chitinophagaceae bacterium LY-5]
MIKIIPVEDKKSLKAFIDFPHSLYKDDKNYVPELFLAQKDLLSHKHPFHSHSKAKYFLAYEGSEVVGRIAGILNNNYNQFTNTNAGFFGFFDTINDSVVVDLLLQEVKTWLSQFKVNTLLGPCNFSTNETCATLIENFDEPPFAMMPYNFPYYNTLLENAGFVKNVDLLAYRFDENSYNEKAVRLKSAFEKRLASKNIIVRPIDKRRFAEEVDKVSEVYNQAWDKNLGFVPMTKDEFRHMAKDLKQVLDPQYCLVAEHEGRIIGFGLAIPNINEILINIKRGRLFPTGIFKLLLGLKKIRSVRIIALGVLEEYRKMGVEACFYASMMERFKELKMKTAEASWILENNQQMCMALENMNARVYKKYRIYEKSI